MYFIGETPVDPVGMPTTEPISAPAVVEPISMPEPIPAGPSVEPPITVSEPAGGVSVVPAGPPLTTTALPPVTVTLPVSVSTGAPAPVDYSSKGTGAGGGSKYGRRGHYGGKHHRTPVNIFYTDPTPYYYPPVSYAPAPQQQSPIYVVRSGRGNGMPQINWLLVLSLAALVLLLKR